MTSEEIRSTPSSGKELEIAQLMWLREIALQLALSNERNARMDEYCMGEDAKDAEREEKKAAVLPEFIAKANETLDRIRGTVIPVPGNKESLDNPPIQPRRRRSFP